MSGTATGAPRLLPRVRAAVVVTAPVPAPAPRRVAARRALAWGVAVVALAHVGFAIALETVLPTVRDPEHGYREARVLDLQRAAPNRPLVLFFGTSRTQNAIDPGAMDLPGGYNFGLSGARPVQMRLALRRVLAAGARPTAVLVELHPLALIAPEPGDAVFPDASRLAAADLRVLEPHLTDPAALRRRWVRARANCWAERGPVLLGRLAPSWVPRSQRAAVYRAGAAHAGFVPQPEAGADERRPAELAVARAVYAARLAAGPGVAPPDRAYFDLAADCRAAGVPMAFFTLPESPEFRSWYGPGCAAALAARARTLGAGCGCPVFDGSAEFAEGDFADGHHMLRPAAARFGRWFADTHLTRWPAGGR